MKRLLIILLILSACACNGQAIRFSEPIFDTTQLPDASTSVLLHFENNIIDLGGGVWTSSYDGFASDAYKFGSYSIYNDSVIGFNGVGNAGTTNSTAMLFGSGDFTVDFWMYFDLTTHIFDSSYNFFQITRDYDAGFFSLSVLMGLTAGKYTPMLYYSANFNSIALNGAGSERTSPEWIHFCVERRSGITYGYIDGVQVFTGADASNTTAIGSINITANQYNHTTARTHIDELRIKKGGYVYGGEFAPPTRAIGVEKPMEIKLSDGEIKF